MKSIAAIAAGLTVAFTSSAFAHSDAGIPHVHLDNISDGTPAHVAGLVVIVLIVMAAGACWISKTSSQADNRHASPDDLMGGPDAK